MVVLDPVLTDVMYKKGEELPTAVTWQEVMERCKCSCMHKSLRSVLQCIVVHIILPYWDEIDDEILIFTHFFVCRVIQGMNLAHSLTTCDGKTIMR